jgi:hypothetical protein
VPLRHFCNANFETEDSGRCSVETHGEIFFGHFILEHIEFTRERLLICFDRPDDKEIGFTFLKRLPRS